MPAPGRWMPTSKLRVLYQAGLELDEIAEINEVVTGWKPTRSAVSRKFARMGEPPRYSSHADLLPWKVAPEHNSSEIRHMLQAESRKRQGMELSETDKTLIHLLHHLLYRAPGYQMVVTYNRHDGFGLAPRQETDTDIVRGPDSHDVLEGQEPTDGGEDPYPRFVAPGE